MRISFLHSAILLTVGFAAWGCSKPAGTMSQQTFDTPDAAVEAMFNAVSTNDTTALFHLLGPESREIAAASDPVQAMRERQVVTASMNERWWLEGDGNTRTLVIGNESFPLPIPLVQEQGKWRFDTAAGREELLARRIGRNELAAMDVAAAFVAAQREYAARGHDGVPKGAFAQRLLSEEGRHNGLFWPTSARDPEPSPMGERVAQAAAEGYTKDVTAYYGYHFKILTGQGPSAPGGARSWIEGGVMTGGFGLIAWPAEHGASGVMTFMVGPDGVLREKDLGADTQALAAGIEVFDPDSSWSTPEPVALQ
jgi:hypothetical protein